MLVFILLHHSDDIHYGVADLLADYANTFHTSSVALSELLFLHKIGKVETPFPNVKELLGGINQAGIEIVYFNKYHFNTYQNLQIVNGHKDMNDHAIIAQAISDKIPLISSDHVFQHYIPQGLDFVFNKR
jgi:PIN domain nuclease of toxin-antitoxin system